MHLCMATVLPCWARAPPPVCRIRVAFPPPPPPPWVQMIVVDPAAASPGDYTSRIELETSEYAQAVLFDHIISRRT